MTDRESSERAKDDQPPDAQREDILDDIEPLDEDAESIKGGLTYLRGTED